MRLLFWLLIFFCSINVISQQLNLPELPMKDGKIYYVFNNALENKKQCLKIYHNMAVNKVSASVQQKLIGRNNERHDNTLAILFGSIDKNSNLSSPMNKCVDTIESGYFIFTIPKDYSFFDKSIMGLTFNVSKSRAIVSQIVAEPYFVYTSQNEYELKFRKFTLNQTPNPSIDLSEYYNELKKKPNLTKNDIQIFTELNQIMVLINEAFSECLKFEYENEELD